MHPLKAFFVASNTTAASLAPRVPTATAYLSQIMTGHRRPSPQMAEAIAAATGGVVKAADLVFWHTAKRKRAA